MYSLHEAIKWTHNGEVEYVAPSPELIERISCECSCDPYWPVTRTSGKSWLTRLTSSASNYLRVLSGSGVNSAQPFSSRVAEVLPE